MGVFRDRARTRAERERFDSAFDEYRDAALRLLPLLLSEAGQQDIERALIVAWGAAGQEHDGCPVCDVDAVYVERLDRYFHADGSANDACWLAVLRSDAWGGS